MEDARYPFIEREDPEVARLIEGEDRRQAEGLELIPSENYVSRAVKEAMASSLTNKYSEGYPGKRYYGGQDFTDPLEELAIERAKRLFNADHANVQPLGGAAANIAAYFAWLEPGDTVLGMDLAHGGHLTHGAPVTYMARLFTFVRYGMKDADTGEIDYDALEQLAKEVKPKIVLAGFSAYPRELDWRRIAEIARGVGAVAMADVAHIAGLIAGGVAKNPLDEGFHLMTTTTHKTLRGPRGGMILSKGVVSSPLKAPEKTIENLPTLIDRAVFPGLQGGPHMHQIAAKAVALHEAAAPSFKEYAKRVVENAQAMAEVFNREGARLITGGTDNHLLLADVFSSFGLGGKEAEERLDAVGVTLNKNSIAGDSRKPFDPSGIRFGTPAMTTRGFSADDCRQVAELMIRVLRDASHVPAAREAIKVLALAHPIPDSFS
ncbi:MAG: serine hydroxymethyltransferase [Patescibacteria group bacterium]|nr:serine hydroxymethyltransferase [Patescibacteria group bacterium]MDE1944472.1 serine hydroxymethyltransferase [Patescibacteria group bacterium]MDE1944773.1 serine hydroxymethyltransferase [Patescibacteria group bacterium]MDE2057226.1 serine hydroxymethyltransferase [Patescibacteria group bacterium]